MELAGPFSGDSHMPGQYSAGVSDHGFWAVQSLVTDPGPAAAAIDRLPSGLGTLRAASQCSHVAALNGSTQVAETRDASDG